MSSIFETDEYRIKGNENLPYDPSPVVEGHTYDLESSSDKSEVTLTEDGEDKTTLPLVATFVGTRAEWNALSATEKAKYRIVHFTDESEGISDAYDIPHGQSNVGNDLDDLQDAVTDLNNDLKNLLNYVDIDVANIPVSNLENGTYYSARISTPISNDEEAIAVHPIGPWTIGVYPILRNNSEITLMSTASLTMPASRVIRVIYTKISYLS